MKRGVKAMTGVQCPTCVPDRPVFSGDGLLPGGCRRSRKRTLGTGHWESRLCGPIVLQRVDSSEHRGVAALR